MKARGRRRQHRSRRARRRSAASGCCLRERGWTSPRIAVAASVGKKPSAGLQQAAKLRSSPPATKSWTLTFRPRPPRSAIRIRYSLAAQVQAAGGEPVLLPIAPDEPAAPARTHRRRPRSPICCCLPGGVSMGKYDLVEQVLAEFQAEFFFTGAQIQPGKPVVFRKSPVSRALAANSRHPAHIYFFGLPGNPVSTMVTFELFARPVLEALAGMTPRKLVFLNARLKSEIKTKTGLKRFLPGNSLRRIRRRGSGTGGMARIGRHCVHGPGELLHRDSSGSRARLRRGSGCR